MDSIWLILMVFVFNGCTLKTPDVEICFVLPSYKAACKYSVSGDERILTSDEWFDFQIGRFTMSADGFSEYQKFIKVACERMTCTDGEKKALAEIELFMNKVKSIK